MSQVALQPRHVSSWLSQPQALTFVGPASPALRAGRAGRASLLVRRAASDETMGKVAEVRCG